MIGFNLVNHYQITNRLAPKKFFYHSHSLWVIFIVMKLPNVALLWQAYHESAILIIKKIS